MNNNSARAIINGVRFVGKNPTMLYSIILIFVVTGIIFFNSYYSIEKYEYNISKILQSKGGTIGTVLATFSADEIDDGEELRKKMESVKEQDSEIKDMAVLKHDSEGDNFSVVAATGEGDVFQSGELQSLYGIAWVKGDAVASVGEGSSGRFWNVASLIKNADGKKTGVVLTSLWMSKWDELSLDTARRIYYFTIGSLVFVLLIIMNHARLFKYELKATKLEEVDKMKDDFISMASHELKSPLTAIKGYADLLSDGIRGYDPEKKKEYMRYINNIGISVTRLRDLVEDILEVSRLEQNRIPIKMENIDLVSLVAEVFEEMKISADEKKLKMENNVSVSPLVEADRDRAKQIMVNLVSNAIKYTPFGDVSIKSKEDARFVYITVADTGLGMSAESMKNLFSKFYRIKTDKTAVISGTGLGLWISKEIALKMGGDLSVESIEGVGSHFTLKLKKAK